MSLNWLQDIKINFKKKETTSWVLSDKDFNKVVDILQNPPPASQELKDLIKKYKENIMPTNTVTVKELREAIANLKDNDLVYFNMNSGCCAESELLENPNVDTVILKKDSYCEIRFSALPGYRSCIQVSKTKEADEEYWKGKK